jgi:SNF2 family DNA or RNA helicase
MMELRKCCNHPYLIKGVEEDVVSTLKTAEEVFNASIQCSGKLVLIDKLLPRLRESNHKVLVFSQMVKVLDILEDYLIYKSYPYERLDGGIRGNDRQAAIDRFSRPDSDRFVFLLSTRAGGLGINLTAADTGK